MYNSILLSIFLSYALVNAQQKTVSTPSTATKGASPIANSPSTLTGQTYAVVIGISDYEDKDIPDLKFATRVDDTFANCSRLK